MKCHTVLRLVPSSYTGIKALQGSIWTNQYNGKQQVFLQCSNGGIFIWYLEAQKPCFQVNLIFCTINICMDVWYLFWKISTNQLQHQFAVKKYVALIFSGDSMMVYPSSGMATVSRRTWEIPPTFLQSFFLAIFVSHTVVDKQYKFVETFCFVVMYNCDNFLFGEETDTLLVFYNQLQESIETETRPFCHPGICQKIDICIRCCCQLCT